MLIRRAGFVMEEGGGGIWCGVFLGGCIFFFFF